MNPLTNNVPKTLKFWVGVQRGQSYLMGRSAFLTLFGHPSSDGITIKVPYGVDVLLRLLGSVETDFGK